jgi:hypothetical protein
MQDMMLRLPQYVLQILPLSEYHTSNAALIKELTAVAAPPSIPSYLALGFECALSFLMHKPPNSWLCVMSIEV